MTVEQTPLNLGLRDEASFYNFYVSEANQQFVAYLEDFLNQKTDRVLYCWGASGEGKSHLLQASCQKALAERFSAIYVPLAEHNTLSEHFLDNIETISLICLDDIHLIATDATWEESVFHLYNRTQLTGSRLLITADCPPLQLSLKLKDLISRLSAASIFHLQGLTETEKITALQRRAELRGLSLSDQVAHYLLSHFPRDNKTLFDTLNKLDKASLIAQRKLTIPFVKSVLN